MCAVGISSLEPYPMRLTEQQHHKIIQIVQTYAGCDAVVTLFGSRVDDQKRGGDVDLMISLKNPIENPAWLSAQIAAKISRLMHGRKVDILLSAPNLQEFEIHQIARETGVAL